MSLETFQNQKPDIADRVFIHEKALVIGNVSIGEDSSVWPMAVVRGDIQEIKIGRRSNIQDGTICHVTHDSIYSPGGKPLLIGDDVTIGHKVILHACTIESLSLIGMGSIILDGAVIQSKVILGAGSLVTPNKILESGYLWMGSPVRKVRPLKTEELEFLQHSADSYVALKNRYFINNK